MPTEEERLRARADWTFAFGEIVPDHLPAERRYWYVTPLGRVEARLRSYFVGALVEDRPIFSFCFVIKDNRGRYWHARGRETGPIRARLYTKQDYAARIWADLEAKCAS